MVFEHSWFNRRFDFFENNGADSAVDLDQDWVELGEEVL